jgi:feruloyl esterase
MRHPAVSALAIGALLGTAVLAAPARAAPADTCAGLTASPALAGVSAKSARSVAPDPAHHLPAFCEVTATLSPAPGSQIGVVYRLPEPAAWNGKIVGLGGGGYAGNVTLKEAAPELAQGYATAQTDTGHPSPKALDTSWILKGPGDINKAQVIDFGWRAVHAMTVAGKVVVAAYYGKPQRRAYWAGCSTGGRQGLAEMQRFPADYDGISAGAPVYNLAVYANAALRTQFFHKDPASNLTPALVKTVAAAVQAACDMQDGIKDGILTDPRQCKWDPAVLQCGAAGAPGAGQCLTPKQVATVRNMYAGKTLPDGTVAADPIMRGGELDWITRSVGNPKMPLGLNALLGAPFIAYMLAEKPDYDILAFDPAKELKSFQDSFAAKEIVMQDPDVTPFLKLGGKLLLWHGFNDPGPNPLETIKYMEAVARTVGPKLHPGAPPLESIRQDVRLFLVPGVFHCRGGPGTDQFDTVSALDAWVEHGTAPARIIATKTGSPLRRPLCPYPQVAKYKGSGDTNDPGNFVCE